MNCNENEPKSWVDILKQKEATRNMPPRKQYYEKPQIVKYEEAGIFNRENEHNAEFEKSYINVDTSFYEPSEIFVPLPPRKEKQYVKRDHGLDLISWDETKFDDEIKPKTIKRLDLSKVNNEFDIISQKPKVSPFKFNVAQLLEQKNTAKQILSARPINPITNSFPSQEAESARIENEETMRKLSIERKISKLPLTERRNRGNLVNIITCEAKDEDLADKMYQSTSPRTHGISGAYVEMEMQKRRENERLVEMLRFEKKRNSPAVLKHVRDWNPILGNEPQKRDNEVIQSLPSVRKWIRA